MGDVINLAERRAARAEVARPVKQKSIADLASSSVEGILIDWEKMAKRNRLNDYFKSSIPNLVGNDNDENYMADLNAISKLELNIGLYPQINFPGTMNSKQIGWVVQFMMQEEMVPTPELACEAYARCFAILMYVRVKRAALEAGYIF